MVSILYPALGGVLRGLMIIRRGNQDQLYIPDSHQRLNGIRPLVASFIFFSTLRLNISATFSFLTMNSSMKRNFTSQSSTTKIQFYASILSGHYLRLTWMLLAGITVRDQPSRPKFHTLNQELGRHSHYLAPPSLVNIPAILCPIATSLLWPPPPP